VGGSRGQPGLGCLYSVGILGKPGIPPSFPPPREAERDGPSVGGDLSLQHHFYAPRAGGSSDDGAPGSPSLVDSVSSLSALQSLSLYSLVPNHNSQKTNTRVGEEEKEEN